jgi:hypothetical protein
MCCWSLLSLPICVLMAWFQERGRLCFLLHVHTTSVRTSLCDRRSWKNPLKFQTLPHKFQSRKDWSLRSSCGGARNKGSSNDAVLALCYSYPPFVSNVSYTRNIRTAIRASRICFKRFNMYFWNPACNN